MKYNAVIFDLDGTLTDTLADLRNSVNYALTKLGFPERSAEEIRSFVGNGVKRLIRLSVPEDTSEEKSDECLAIFREHYAANSLVETKPYDGIIQLLSELKSRGVRLAVVTNKTHSTATGIVKHFFGELIELTIGQTDGIARKPQPDGIFKALEALDVMKENAVYVGDSDVDCKTARNAGIPCIGVSWGFRDREVLIESGADFIADSVTELSQLII